MLGVLQLERTIVYLADIENGANMITINGGHLLDAICYVLGEFESVTATTHNARKTIEVRDKQGNKIRDAPLTSHDQMSVSGVLTSGAYASVHLRGGLYKGTHLLMGDRRYPWRITS